MSTILEVPFFYHAQVLETACRNPADISVMEVVPVRVGAADPADAPVVARCDFPFKAWGVPGDAWSSHGVDYRFHRGGLLRRVALPQGANAITGWRDLEEDGAQAALTAFVRVRRASNDTVWANPLVPEPGTYADVRLRETIPVRRWMTDDREERLAALRASVAKAAFIGGHLYVPSKGPGWVVRVDPGHRSARPMAVPEAGHCAPALGPVFPPADLDGALAEARRLAEARNFSAGRPLGAAEVLDTMGTLAARGRLVAMREAGARVLAACEGVVTSLPPSGIRAYADVKEALLAPPHGDPDHAEAFLRALRHLNEAWCARVGADPAAAGNPVADLLPAQGAAIHHAASAGGEATNPTPSHLQRGPR